MERAIINFPCSLSPVVTDWHLDVRGRSAGESVDGNGQVVYGLQPRWTAKLDFSLFTREMVLTWRAVVGKLRGRVNLLRIEICDPQRMRYAEIGIPEADIELIKGDGIPHSTGAIFSNGAGYAFNPAAPITAAADAGAEEIRFTTAYYNGALQAGHYLSIDDWLYVVVSSVEDGDETVLTIEPPLRRAAPLGTEIRAFRPSVLMALVSDGEGRAALDMGKRGGSSLELVEWVNRP